MKTKLRPLCLVLADAAALCAFLLIFALFHHVLPGVVAGRTDETPGENATFDFPGRFTDGAVDILTLLVKTGLCASRGDARRNVEQGGVTAGDEKVTDIGKTFGKDAFADGLVLRRGKKNYKKLVIK